MKKSLLLLMLVAILAIAAACGGSDDNDNDTPEVTPPVEDVQEEPQEEEPQEEPQEEEPQEEAPTALERGSVDNAAVVALDSDGLNRLPADEASFRNAALDGDVVTYFAADGAVSWNVDVSASGSYRVTIVHERNAGGYAGFRLTGGVWDVEGELRNTNGSREADVVGYIALAEGSHTITLEPTSLVDGEFAAIPQLLLQHAGDIRATVAGGTTVLSHDIAVLENGGNREPENIGGFYEGVSVRWPIRVPEQGNYRVVVYAAAYHDAGGVARLSYVHDRVTRDFVIEPTGGLHNFTAFEVGEIGLRGGEYDLRIDIAELNGAWLMNLNRIELVRVGDFAPTHPVFEDTILPVATAQFYGETGPNPEGNWYNIGGFRRTYAVIYSPDIQEAGRYEVIISHSGNYGGAGELHINGEVVADLDIQHSGGWGYFMESSIGVWDFEEGVSEIRIQALPSDLEWFMNHNYIRLVRQ